MGHQHIQFSPSWYLVVHEISFRHLFFYIPDTNRVLQLHDVVHQHERVDLHVTQNQAFIFSLTHSPPPKHESASVFFLWLGLNVFKAGFRRASERSRVGAQIHGLLDTSSWDRNGIGSVLEEAMTRFAVMQRQTEERFRVWMEKLAHLDSDNDSSKRSSDAPEGGQQQQAAQLSPPSSFLPSSESAETMAAYMLARESNSLAPAPINNNNLLPEAVAQNGNLAVPDPGLLNV